MDARNLSLYSYGIFGSLQFDSVGTICGSGAATDEIILISLALTPDSCVEFKKSGVLCTGVLCSPDGRSTHKTSESGDKESLKLFLSVFEELGSFIRKC